MTLIAVEDRPVYELKTSPAVPGSYQEAIERARALKPKLRERVPETEQLRRLHSCQRDRSAGERPVRSRRRPSASEARSWVAEAMIHVTIAARLGLPLDRLGPHAWTAHMWLLALFLLGTLD